MSTMDIKISVNHRCEDNIDLNTSMYFDGKRRCILKKNIHDFKKLGKINK